MSLEGLAVEYLLSIPVLLIFGGCGKLAMLTDLRISVSSAAAATWSRSVFEGAMDLNVGILGLEIAWPAPAEGRGLEVFEELLCASLDVAVGTGIFGDSEFDDGALDFATGNLGKAELGGATMGLGVSAPMSTRRLGVDCVDFFKTDERRCEWGASGQSVGRCPSSFIWKGRRRRKSSPLARYVGK